jgi:hypothetical protein
VARRRSGIDFAISAARSSGIDGVPSFTVRIVVGATALTRIPCGPSSLASDAVRPTIPAFAAA